jgi:hypothetical protein
MQGQTPMQRTVVEGLPSGWLASRQLYVVFHFQTNSNALWLENFLLFVRTISWLHFSHWFKFQVFQVAESHVTEIKAATEKIKRVQIVKLRKGLSCLSNQFFWVVNGLE